MKIIVTGGAGFIGSHIVDAYVNAGHEVTIIDNLKNGSRDNINLNADFREIDILDYNKLDAVFEEVKPDVLNHHAALVSVVDSMGSPTKVFATNDLGTYNVVDLFGKYSQGPRRLIFASTGGGIYGNAKVLPTDEESTPKPLSPYAESKMFAEKKIQYLQYKYKLSVVILRYANVYGPRQGLVGEAGVVPIFRKYMKAGMAPTIYGDGTKTRDYVYVSDIVSANVQSTNLVMVPSYEVYNISSGKETTDKQVYDIIAKSTGFKNSPIYEYLREGEVLRSCMKSDKAQIILDWDPSISFEQGIQLLESC